MPAMTDPMAALISFDRELKRGLLEAGQSSRRGLGRFISPLRT